MTASPKIWAAIGRPVRYHEEIGSTAAFAYGKGWKQAYFYTWEGSGLEKKGALREQSFGFALRIVKAYQHLCDDKREFVLSKQLLRSGTAIGALVREAEQGESRADFVHKLAIALKEANETEYWIELLHQAGYIDDRGFESLIQDVKQLLKLLTSIIKTSKRSL